eukprot:COSAG01_NODE_31768_length_591_cov_15.203252_2_plen_46_part_01
MAACYSRCLHPRRTSRPLMEVMVEALRACGASAAGRRPMAVASLDS